MSQPSFASFEHVDAGGYPQHRVAVEGVCPVGDACQRGDRGILYSPGGYQVIDHTGQRIVVIVWRRGRRSSMLALRSNRLGLGGVRTIGGDGWTWRGSGPLGAPVDTSV